MARCPALTISLQVDRCIVVLPCQLSLGQRCRSPSLPFICSPEEPRLITTGRPVRKGTNGGVTLLGFGAALAGGLFMGLTFWLASLIRCGTWGLLSVRL